MSVHTRHQFFRGREIRIRVLTTKILKRCAIDDRSGRRAQSLLEDVMRIRSGDSIHRVKLHAKAASEELTESLKVKQLFKNRNVVCEWVNNYDLGFAQSEGAFLFEVDVRFIKREILRDVERVLIDAFSERCRSRTAVADVVLNAEVGVPSDPIVTCRKDHAPYCTL